MVSRCRVIAFFAVLGVAVGAAAADLDSKIRFNIPAEPVSAALSTFADQSGIQVMTATANLTGIESPGVSGVHTARAALEAVLKGTGLVFRAISDRAVTIESSRSAAVSTS